jgi:hypothetical protein
VSDGDDPGTADQTDRGFYPDQAVRRRRANNRSIRFAAKGNSG